MMRSDSIAFLGFDRKVFSTDYAISHHKPGESHCEHASTSMACVEYAKGSCGDPSQLPVHAW